MIAFRQPGHARFRVRVWDIPIRLFHWSIVLLVGICWVTGKNDLLRWHKLSGYAVLSLVLFRLYWGVFGSQTARFSQFLRGPRAVSLYVRSLRFRDGLHSSIGHNPLGGWNVLALLLGLFTQTISGLFAVDVDGVESGPLARFVSFGTGRHAATVHREAFSLLLVVIGVHVAAVAGYLVLRRDNLIMPMLTGTKSVPNFVASVHNSAAPWVAWVALAVSILLVLLVAVVV
jgi:cytochrome b